LTSTLPGASVRNALAQAAQAYGDALEGSPAEEYLAARGIGLSTARMYRLGYVREPMPGDEEYTGRLVIAYDTPGGVVDLRFRTLGPDGPKYLSRVGSHIRMYNVNALRKPTSVLAVCEGELDAVVMDGLVGVPAVGIPGSQGWQKHFSLLLSDYHKVIVMADGDAAGRDFAKKVTGSLGNAVAVSMPEGSDVNDVYLIEGYVGLHRRAGLSE